MNRRTVLGFLSALPFMGFFGFSNAKKLKLYEIDYAPCIDQPYIYTAYSLEEAREAYKNDCGEEISSEFVRELEADEILVYGEEQGKTAAEFVKDCYHPNCCVLCDSHYC